jgi:dihydropyrimidinase
MKKLIKNGIIHNFNESLKADILIDNGIIIEIKENINPEYDMEIVDAEYMYILPGGVDVHTHLNLKLGDKQVSDGFYEGTKAAAFGGTTTIVDHPEGCEKKCPLLTKPNEYKKKLEKESVIDFGIHGVFQRLEEDIISDIPVLIRNGFYSAKVYTTYDLMLSYDEIEKIVRFMDENRGITCFHAEDNDIIEKGKNYCLSGNFIAVKYHPVSRKDDAESFAISKLAKIAKMFDAEIYIVHLSSGKGLDEIINNKNDGVKIFTETCPQYLLLDESFYEKDDGLKYVMSPPLRKKEDIKFLWEGIKKGYIDVIGTDHCSFSYEDKLKYGKDNVFNCPGGIPGVETRMPLMYEEMVNKRNMSINKFVELCCFNPAKIMGFSHKKGSLEIGKDADIVIWNPKKQKIFKQNDLNQKVDYTPYENFKVRGYPVLVMLRGEIIIKNERFCGEKGQGKFIFRKRSY